ncbi:hypothetical protein [Salinibacter ruber]|uniref:hypothetical protein n=1 Tax=Salinibacter ruber TaxID=146919 RepID=UPI000C9F59CA|nr:hypothetical protein [Salinibacter ruber]
MPHLLKSARARLGSNSPADPLQKAAPPSPQFTESQQSSSPSGPDREGKSPDAADRLPSEKLPSEKLPSEELPSEELSPEELPPGELSPGKLSLDATEPFPPGLFRVPIPNAVFGRMPEMSDSALRCLLALIHLSFRFDPAEGEWTSAEGWLSRSDVEAASGLSGQGTRNGLSELESIGWACVDRSGRSYHYQLALGVPTARFTQVPTALLDKLPALDTGTDLRVVLAVLRGTWGWTSKEMDPQSGTLQAVHDRWTELSSRALAKMTGRSKTAVTRAAKALQGTWIGRVRPESGACRYRFLPEAVGDTPGSSFESKGSLENERSSESERSSGSGRSEDSESFCRGDANDLTPDRQNSDPPSFHKESFSRDKHSQLPQRDESGRETKGSPSGKRSAVPDKKQNGTGRPLKTRSRSRKSRGHSKNRMPGEETARGRAPGLASEDRSPPADFSDLPVEKRQLAKKLANVGVWAGRVAELLSRFSCDRIRANFQLYRRRAAEQTIRKPGAWLYKAITDGYVLPSSESETGDPSSTGKAPAGGASAGSPSSCGTLSSLEHKETVSEAEKDEYIAQGVSEERFHRCLSGRGGGRGPQYMYFDPEAGGPTRRV